MSMYISAEKCVGCGACWVECPVNAVTDTDKFQIIEEKCLDCSACSYVCNFDAILYDRTEAIER